MLWALIIALIVGVIITVMAMSMMTKHQATSDQRALTRAGAWTQTAALDLATRLESFSIGPNIYQPTPAGMASGDRLLCVFAGCPVTDALLPSTEVTTTPLGKAIRLTRSSSSTAGYYQILAPGTGQPAWTGVQYRAAGTASKQGTIDFIIRAWQEKSTTPRPVTTRVTFQRQSLARFAILSDERLDIGVAGSINLGTVGSPAIRIHSNNVAKDANGAQLNNLPLTNVESVSTRAGTITGCLTAAKCKQQTGETFSFSTASRSFAEVRKFSTPLCPPADFSICTFDPINDELGLGAQIDDGMADESMPMWVVDISTAAVNVSRIPWKLREDIGTAAAPDDYVGPIPGEVAAPVGTYTPAAGGGVMLFDGDVVVSGQRPAGAPPLTIMAERSASFPDRFINKTFVPTRIPASIYLVQNAATVGTTASIGATDALAPLGLVADGGVYAPSYAMGGTSPTNVNNTLVLNNVAIIAATDRFAYGPAIASIATDPLTSTTGLQPSDAAATGYGQGSSITINGSVASTGFMRLQYGTAPTIGYPTRTLNYVSSLSWSPPPMFPSDSSWRPVRAVPVDG